MSRNGKAAESQPAATDNGPPDDALVSTGSVANSASVLDTVSVMDAEWFKSHPNAECYIRPLIPGEYGPFEDQIDYTHILVIQMAPGARARSGLRIFHESDTPLTELVDYQSGARWAVTFDGKLIPIPPETREAWQVLCDADTQKLIKAGRRVKQ